jgi:hypothetical protein
MLALIATGVSHIMLDLLIMWPTDNPCVIGQVYTAIKEWESGTHIKADFGSNIFKNTYRRHVDFLRKILKDGPNKYHTMMHRIYIEARSIRFSLLPSIFALTTTF